MRQGLPGIHAHAKAGIRMSTHVIPPITDPLGSGWQQPSRESILIDDTHAVMNYSTFKELPEYSASNPTGVYPGKMWRRHDGEFDGEFLAKGGRPVWLLCWFGESKKGAQWCSNNYRKILLADADISKL